MRQPTDWMRPMHDRILEALQTAGITLSPAIIAYNLERSREAANRRLAKLAERGLVEKIERGRYKINNAGEDYLQGELDVRNLSKEGKVS